MTITAEPRSLTPHFPTYSKVCHFLQIMQGVKSSLYHRTAERIYAHRGSPQEQEDWSDPDVWIVERLSGEERQLAFRVWKESMHDLNPRHMRGAWLLSQRHKLLERSGNDILQRTTKGQAYLEHPTNGAVVEIDFYEGIFAILQLVAERGPGRRSDFLPQFASYCRTETTFHSESSIKSAL